MDRQPLKKETVYVLCCGHWIAHITEDRTQHIHFFSKRGPAVSACRAFNRKYPERAALHVRKLRLESKGFKNVRTK